MTIKHIHGRGLCDVSTRDEEPSGTGVEDARGRRTKDELLQAVEPGKLIQLGNVWDGIGERLDAMVAELTDLENGLTSGNTLSAEDVAEYSGLNRARQALTDFQQAVHDARGIVSDGRSRTTDAGRGGRTERVRFTERPDNQTMSAANRQNAARFTDRQRSLGGAAPMPSSRTTDSGAPFTPPARRPMTIDEINAVNRRNAARFTDSQRTLGGGGTDDEWQPPRAA